MNAEIDWTEYGPLSKYLKCDKLSNLCVEKVGVQTGPFGSQLHNADYVEIGTPIITVEHLGDNRIGHLNTPFVSDEDKNRLSKYHLEEGDIVFSRVGSVDRRALVRKEEDGWLFSGRCLRVRVDREKIDPIYLSYFFGLKSFKKYIRSIAVGATMPSINTKILSDVPIYYPEDLQVQRRIAEIFYACDEKIELNRQTNQTLEQIAQAIFKSWFVDFEPVKAKIQAKQNSQNPEHAAMCAISGKSLEELEQLSHETQQQLKTTAALFPDALVESELGEIPERWKVSTMEELSSIVAMGPFGSNIKVSTFVSDGIPVVSGQHLKGTMLEDNKFNYVTLEHADKLKKANVKRGDVVFTHAGSIGQVAYIPDKSRYERYVLSQRQFYMRPNQELISPLFITYYFKSHIGQYELLSNASQVGVPSISRPVSNLRNITTVVPDKSLSDAFHWLVNTMHNNIAEKNEEINVLVNIRDLLLPKLLSDEASLNNIQTARDAVAV